MPSTNSEVVETTAGAVTRTAGHAADLVPKVYSELRRLAAVRLGRLPPGQTLQATALVHEAVARLLGRGAQNWQDSGHFFFAAARAMHDILVEEARRKLSAKGGGGRRRIGLDQAAALRLRFPADAPPADLLALHEALERLKADEPRWHQLVLLRFFAGLNAEQCAAAMCVGLRTVERDWRFIRARLHRELAAS
jgi:RNA polymerase sigma factor (TIGR02999 family)